MNYVERLRSSIGHDPIILVGAVVIVLDDKNRILLQQRVSPHGKWGLPGGLMELTESTEETAKREVLEECGLEIDKLELIDVVSGKDCYIKVSNGDEFYSVTVAYVSCDYTGNLQISDNESLDLRFHTYKELPDYIVGSHLNIINKYMGSKRD